MQRSSFTAPKAQAHNLFYSYLYQIQKISPYPHGIPNHGHSSNLHPTRQQKTFFANFAGKLSCIFRIRLAFFHHVLSRLSYAHNLAGSLHKFGFEKVVLFPNTGTSTSTSRQHAEHPLRSAALSRTVLSRSLGSRVGLRPIKRLGLTTTTWRLRIQLLPLSRKS